MSLVVKQQIVNNNMKRGEEIVTFERRFEEYKLAVTEELKKEGVNNILHYQLVS